MFRRARLWRWFRRVVLRRKTETMLDVGRIPYHRVIENQSIKDMDRIDDSQFFDEVLRPVFADQHQAPGVDPIGGTANEPPTDDEVS